MTNIAKSEIAYLGDQYPSSFGLAYCTRAGSTIKNNIMHNLWYGSFSSGKKANNITIRNNAFNNNSIFGIDPR
jgi:hypothetical protein